MIPTCYHGARLGNGGYRMIAHDKDSGGRYPLPYVKRHSRRGMAWGYVGPASADLARSLLIDALGPAAACPLCNGTVYLAWREDLGDASGDPEPYDSGRDHDLASELITDCFCDDGYRALPYHRFQLEHVARWGEHWTITRAAVLRWLVRSYGEEVPSWLLDAIGVRTVELPEVPS
jgi:uncharacterized protein DUF6166